MAEKKIYPKICTPPKFLFCLVLEKFPFVAWVESGPCFSSHLPSQNEHLHYLPSWINQTQTSPLNLFFKES